MTRARVWREAKNGCRRRVDVRESAPADMSKKTARLCNCGKRSALDAGLSEQEIHF